MTEQKPAAKKISIEFTEAQALALLKVIHEGYHRLEDQGDKLGVEITQFLARQVFFSIPSESRDRSARTKMLCIFKNNPQFRSVFGQAATGAANRN